MSEVLPGDLDSPVFTASTSTTKDPGYPATPDGSHPPLPAINRLGQGRADAETRKAEAEAQLAEAIDQRARWNDRVKELRVEVDTWTRVVKSFAPAPRGRAAT